MKNSIIEILSTDEDVLNELKTGLNEEGIETGRLIKEYPKAAQFDPNQIATVLSKIAVIITSGESILKAVETFSKQWKKLKNKNSEDKLQIKVGQKTITLQGVKDEAELKTLLTEYLKEG